MRVGKKLLITLFFLAAFISLFAQSNAEVSGIVTDAKSNAIKGVTVHLLNTNIAVATDETGKYSSRNFSPKQLQCDFGESVLTSTPA